jgi:hypothetical protein
MYDCIWPVDPRILYPNLFGTNQSRNRYVSIGVGYDMVVYDRDAPRECARFIPPSESLVAAPEEPTAEKQSESRTKDPLEDRVTYWRTQLQQRNK